jgi:L-fuconate dehydratase
VQCIDFHHLRDALAEDELLEMLESRVGMKEQNLARLRMEGPRVYSTAGWSGRPLEEVRELCSGLYRQGTRAFKAKVGRGQQYDRTRALAEDRSMLNAIRESTGPDAQLLTDANQNLGDWRNAAAYMMELVEYKPLFIEEAIAYNDVLGYIRLREALAPAGIGVAGGEQAPDAVTFKQMLAGGGLTHCQIDGARVGGVNELFAIIAMAAKCGVPVRCWICFRINGHRRPDRMQAPIFPWLRLRWGWGGGFHQSVRILAPFPVLSWVPGSNVGG